MTVGARAKDRLARLLLGHAANRLRRDRPDWANAMESESTALLTDDERLRWSAGCAVASYRAPGAFDWAIYPARLGAGAMLMVAYQWSADESLRTVAVLGLIGAVLGVLHPQRFLVSGAVIGSVVAAVNGFETITGLRPAYETAAHSLLHDLRWSLLVAPALVATVVGGYAGRKFRSAKGTTR